MMTGNVDKILSTSAPTYRNTGVVEDLDLSKVQLLDGRRVDYVYPWREDIMWGLKI